jgi:hypothetical protein
MGGRAYPAGPSTLYSGVGSPEGRVALQPSGQGHVGVERSQYCKRTMFPCACERGRGTPSTCSCRELEGVMGCWGGALTSLNRW